jgi:hypothetical protein
MAAAAVAAAVATVGAEEVREVRVVVEEEVGVGESHGSYRAVNRKLLDDLRCNHDVAGAICMRNLLSPISHHTRLHTDMAVPILSVTPRVLLTTLTHLLARSVSQPFT